MSQLRVRRCATEAPPGGVVRPTTALVLLALTASTLLAGVGAAAAAPAPPTTRFAAGTTKGVISGRHTWAPAASSRGHAFREPAVGDALLAHAQVGNGRWLLPVPHRGSYRVSIVIRSATRTPAVVDLLGTNGRAVKRVTVIRTVFAATTVAAVTVGAILVSSSGSSSKPVVAVGVNGVHGTPAVSGFTVTPVAPATTTPAKPTSPAVTVTWPSGAFPGLTNDTAAAQKFASYRGRPLNVVDVFHTRDTWDKIANTTYSEDVYAGYTGRLAIALPLLPENLGPSDLPGVAAGDDDSYFVSFATNLVKSNRADSIIRLGWEFNTENYSWAATDPDTFKAAFRRVVGDLRQADPKVVIDWNGNLGYSQVGHDPFSELYPGDDVVDMVGVDVYDNQYNHVTDAASWQAVKAGPDGLDDWAGFAALHNKPFSVPEWGLDNQGPGDNPFFIQQMHDWFAAHAPNLAFEAYFNEPSAYIGDSLDTGQNPRAAALYHQLWQQ